MSNIQIGKFKAGGQEYQKLQINRTLGQSVGDQAYLGRFYSHDGNHSIALSVHDVVSDTMTQYRVFSSNNVENGTWSDVAPTSTINRNDIAVMVRTDGPVITLKLVRTVNATGAKEYRVRCLNLRPIPEKYMKEAEEGYEDTESFSRPVPHMPHQPAPMPFNGPAPMPAPIPYHGPAPVAAPMPMQPVGQEFNPGDPSDIDTRWLARTLMEHVAAPAPHISHEVIARKNRPGGYPGLDIHGKIHNSQIPRGTLTIVVGDKTMTYDGSNDLVLNLCDQETAQSLGISIASSLDGLSAATDNDIADLFDDDPNTPVLDPTDPGYLVIGEDTVVDSGNDADTTTTQTQNGQCCQCHNNQTQQTQPQGNCHHNHMHPHMVPPVMPHMHQHIPPIPPMPGPHFPPPPPPPPMPRPMPQPQQNNSGCCCCNCNNGGNSNPNPAPEPELYSLTLNKNVADSGAVKGAGEYAADTSVVISATPGEGYVFVKWSDENTTSSRTIIMPAADTEYTAYFGYTLTVSSNDDNMGTASGSGNFLPNEVTTIEAHPFEGYHLLRWSDLDRNDEVRSVTVSDNLDIIAYFEEDIRQYTVTLTKNRDDYGEVTGAGVYNEGEDVTITATPNSGYKFVKWSDDVEDAERTFEDIHEDINLQAEFQQLDMRSITAVIKPSASYGSVEGTGDYERGTVITLTAIANPGYKFVKWMTGDNLAYSVTYTSNPLEYTVKSNVEFRAYFEVDNSSPEYTLSLHTNDEALGTVNGAGEYHEGDTVSISAEPIGDNIFVRWNDDITENPRTITMPGEDTWYVAYFGNASSGEITEVEGEHPENTKIIQAFPAEGYHFVRWNDGNQENPRTVPADIADTFTAVFEQDFENPQLDVSVNSEDRGSVNDVGGIYEPFAHVQLLATPKTGFAFMGWSDGVSENPRTVVMDDSYNIKALFDVQYYTLTLLKDNDDHGIFNVDPQGPYTYNQSVSITPVGTEGYHFLRWDDYLDDSPRTVNMTEDKTMTAFFERDSYTLTLQANDDTMCESLTGAGTYVGDEPFLISARAKNGFMFVKWDDECDSAERTYSLTNNTTLTAIFDILKYYITVAVPPSNVSMVTLEGEGYYVPGEQATLKVTVLPGNAIIFDKWNDGDTNNPRTITVTKNAEYTAQFARRYDVTLTVNDAAMGDIQVLVNNEVVHTGTGVVGFKSGTASVLKAIANDGYKFTNWSGLMGDSTNPRPVNINGNYNIQANFAEILYTLTVRSYDNHGSAEIIEGVNPFKPGAIAKIEAIPIENYYRFAHWNDGNKENPRTVTVNGNDTYTAYFELDTFNVNVSSNNTAWGTVKLTATNSSDIISQTDNTYVVNRNAKITLTATEKTGYDFAYWSDNPSLGKVLTRSNINVLHDMTIQAVFEREKYDITLSYFTGHSDKGTLHIEIGESHDPVTGPFAGDTNIRLVATPNEGYEFDKWVKGSAYNYENPREVLVTQTETFTAMFKGKQYTLTLNSEDTTKGSVDIKKGYSTLSNPATVTRDDTVKLIATPVAGYKFLEWDDHVQDAERTYVMPPMDMIFTAYFDLQEYEVKVSSGNEIAGSVGGSGFYKYTQQVTITATANEGYTFTKWNDGNTENPRTFPMPASKKEFTATFTINRYSVTVLSNDTNKGTVKTSASTGITHGSNITLTAAHKTNCHFVSWNNTWSEPVWVVPITSDGMTFTAYFATDTHSVTPLSYDTSRGTVSGGGTAEIGSSLTISASPKNGNHFIGWNDINVNTSRDIIVTTEDQKYTAYFMPTIKSGVANQLIITGVDLSQSSGIKAFYRSSGTSSYTQYDVDNPPILESNKACNILIAHETDSNITNGGDMNTFSLSITPDGENPVYVDNPVVLTEIPGSDSYSADGIKAYAEGDTNNVFPTLFTSESSAAKHIGMVKNGETIIITTQRKLRIKKYAFISSGSNTAKFDIYGSNDGENWELILAYGNVALASGSSTSFYRYGGGGHTIGIATLNKIYGGYIHHKLVYKTGSSDSSSLHGFWLHEAYWMN